MNGMKVRPIGDYIYGRKCINDHVRNADNSVLIYHTQNQVDGDPHGRGGWHEILAVGPDCKFFRDEHVGKFALFPEMETGMHRLGNPTATINGKETANEDFCIREDVLVKHFCAVWEPDND